MPNGRRGSGGRWKWVVPFLPVITLTSCLVVVSTNPTPISAATIVFIALDDRGAAVPSLHVTIVDVAGGWRVDGLTTHEGLFHCGVRSGVTQVRAEVVPPAGYVMAMSDPWPRQFDLSSGGNVRFEVRVKAR